MVTSYKEDNKRLAKNTVALYLRTAIVMIVSLYVSRILLHVLGVDDFGVYNVVGSIVVLFSFLNAAMTAASQRFITYTLTHNDLEESRNVFSASMTIQLLLAVLLILLVELFGVWFLNNRLNIPYERLNAANISFQFSIATFCIHMLRVPYESTVIANEKMTFFAYASIFDALLKLAIVLVLRVAEVDKLILYALLLTIESFLMLGFYIGYCRRKFNTCVFLKVKNRNLYAKLFSFSGWSLMGSATNIATQNGFIFLLNIFCGVAVNAAMGVANQVNTAVTSFVSSFQTSYRPQIVKSYAKGDISHLNSLITSTSKISFSLMVIPTMILLVNMSLILKLWLGNVPNYATEFCQLILACVIIDAITGSYNAAIMATGKIRGYQIAISLSFLMDLLISYALLNFGIVPYLVLLSRIATRGFTNMAIGLYYIRKELDFKIKEYLKSCIFPIMITFLICFPVLFLVTQYSNGWTRLFLSTISISVIMSLCVMYIILERQERTYIFELIKNKLKK